MSKRNVFYGHTTAAEKEAKKFIEAVQLEARDKVRVFLQKLIEIEFRKVRRHYPELQKITFGNGAYVLSFAEGSRFSDYRYGYYERLPQKLHHLCNLCELVEGYADDIAVTIPTLNAEPKAEPEATGLAPGPATLMVDVGWMVSSGPDRFARNHIQADMAVPVPKPSLTEEEMQPVVAAAKTALAKILRARKRTKKGTK